MDTITLSYQGQTVALAVRTRFWLAAHIEALPTAHPDKQHVCFMALYARDVLTGQLPGPYSDQDADRFGRRALTPGVDRCAPPCDRAAGSRSRADCTPAASPIRRRRGLVEREPQAVTPGRASSASAAAARGLAPLPSQSV